MRTCKTCKHSSPWESVAGSIESDLLRFRCCKKRVYLVVKEDKRPLLTLACFEPSPIVERDPCTNSRES